VSIGSLGSSDPGAIKGQTRSVLLYQVLSDLNYLFDVVGLVDEDDQTTEQPPSAVGDLANIIVFFDAPGCGGRSFVIAGNGGFQFLANQGYVFRSNDPTDPIQHYYAVTGTAAADTDVVSRRTFLFGGCETREASFRAVEVFANDPNITGVPNGRFTAPIRLGH
jgi:hypothetical protein